MLSQCFKQSKFYTQGRRHKFYYSNAKFKTIKSVTPCALPKVDYFIRAETLTLNISYKLDRKEKMKYHLLLIYTIFIIGCSSKTKKENNILTIGNGDDVEVTLTIKSKKNIKKVEFYSNRNSEFIYKKRIESYSRIIYNFENKGEGTFKICIYKTNDTICTESYVEKGYAPKIEFVKDSLIITDFIGHNYE